MKNYIFLTAEGQTFAPSLTESDYCVSSVENCQMLGIASGQNQQEALQNLLKENSWIVEVGFNPDEIYGYELAKGGGE